uniref:SP110 nuclear antigen, tandem duplicate 1 n=1 Tax=Hippocampus comes TaxID=109280 RepID=A0A3Q2YRC0_HIPCM
MDFPGDEELLRFFHYSKAEMSCMENPHTFIRQLRDYDLIPEHSYKKVNRTKSKEALKKGLYEILDWLERERPRSIKMFWRCVLKETIVNQYPTLKALRNSLQDGSFQLDTHLFNCKPQEETPVSERKEPPENENIERRQEISVSKKKKNKNNHLCSDEEQPSQSSPSPQKSPFNGNRQEETDVGERKEPSEDENIVSRQEMPVPKQKKKRKINNQCSGEKEPSQLTSAPKKKKILFSSPVKGDKNDIWTWAIYKSGLPVTCGNSKGTLNQERFRKGQPCIWVNSEWLTPHEFERLGGKSSNRNWKRSIQCMDKPLEKLLKRGHLQCDRFRRRAKKLVFTSDDDSNTDSNHDYESDKDSEVDPKEMPSSSQATNRDKSVFNVTCGAVAGKLYRQRFASGTCGLSIRTDTCWRTPADFAKEALGSQNASWKKDILWEGKSLGVVTQENLLRIHPLLCQCKLCKPSDSDLEEQKNDDECFVCKSEGKLVVCDRCPRSFHATCHLPYIDDNILSYNREWICTFCVFSAAREWRYSDELESDSFLSKQISKHLMECQYLLLFLLSADDEQFFATNPCGSLKDYAAVVQTPMWLHKIAEKLDKNHYRYVAEFVSDIQLISSNCALYYKTNPHFLSMGSRLKTLFDEELKNAF